MVIAVGVVGFLAGLAAITGLTVRDLLGSDDDPVRGQAFGEILSPERAERVIGSFEAEGTLSGIPQDHHVWLAVQIGNLHFPKEPEIPSQDRHWAQEVVGAGVPAGVRFALALLMVDAEGHRVIEAWFERGRSGEGFPGLATIPGSVKLDVVRELVLD
ncbi:MAG: hypothetical protein ACRDN6_05665 [Gaiellaceae bacterium]